MGPSTGFWMKRNKEPPRGPSLLFLRLPIGGSAGDGSAHSEQETEEQPIPDQSSAEPLHLHPHAPTIPASKPAMMNKVITLILLCSSFKDEKNYNSRVEITIKKLG